MPAPLRRIATARSSLAKPEPGLLRILLVVLGQLARRASERLSRSAVARDSDVRLRAPPPAARGSADGFPPCPVPFHAPLPLPAVLSGRAWSSRPARSPGRSCCKRWDLPLVGGN